MILKDLPIGTVVTDKKTKFNGKPIEWFVADHEKYQNGTVLFSKDIICCKPFDNSKVLSYKDYHPIYWENSSIRNWLKTDFFYKSFSIQLRCMSIPVEISEYDKNDLTEKIKDNVFLLSTFEVGYVDNYDKTLQLFKNNTTKNKYITSEACLGLKYPWWLRTPIVEDSRCICFIDEHSLLGNTNACYGNMGIRPACVISDYTPIKEKKNGDYRFDWSPFKFNWKKQLDKHSIEEIIDCFNQTQIVSN